MAKIPSQMQTRFNDEVDRVCVNWPTGRKTNEMAEATATEKRRGEQPGRARDRRGTGSGLTRVR